MKKFTYIAFTFFAFCTVSCQNYGENKVESKSTMKAAVAIDPVCNMKGEFADTSYFKGKTYSFCSKGCKEEFKAVPEKYLSAK